MQNKYIIANWKCTKTIDESVEWVATVGPQVENTEYEIVVCPPFTALNAVKELIQTKGYKLSVGAQTVSSYEKGAFTGEIGAFMLQGLVSYALLGHSERRSNKHETNEDISLQVSQCLQYGIKPVVLVRTHEDTIPEGVEIFAWEPVSAIGTGNAVSVDQAKETIKELSHNGIVKGLYGGSVNASNIASFIQCDSIAGVLIGSASYAPASFMEMLNALR